MQAPLSVVDDNQEVVGALPVVGATKKRQNVHNFDFQNLVSTKNLLRRFHLAKKNANHKFQRNSKEFSSIYMFFKIS